MLGTRYVALFSDASGAPRVTSFAAVRVDSATLGLDPGGAAAWILTGVKLGSILAPENASAVPALASDVSVLLPESSDRGALLAPVLAR